MDEKHNTKMPDQENQTVNCVLPKRNSPGAKFWGCLALSVILTIAFIFLGIQRMQESFRTARENTSSIYYQTAYDFAEEQNHVSNYVAISIGAEQEVSRLEVLTVSDSEFIIKDADKDNNTTSWLEVQGKGVFTVDLDAAEFIADSERQHVLVKIPNPVLTNCAVSGTGKQFWHSSEFPLTNGCIAEGVRLSQEQFAEGRIQLEDSMRRNRRFHEAAQSSAKLAIESIVKKWNPDIPDLQVEIEFFESN